MPVLEPWSDPWNVGVLPPSACPEGFLDLAGSEGPHGCAPMAARRALEAVQRSRPDEVEAGQRLRSAISRRHSVPPDSVAVAGGCRLLLPAVLRGCGSPTGEAPGCPRLAVPAPVSPLHRLSALQAGLDCVDLPPHEDGKEIQGWVETLQATRPVAVLLGHPSNPFGEVFTLAELRTVLAAAEGLGVTVIVDEAYADYARDETFRCAALLDEHANLVVLRSLSSLYGLGILPVAYALAAPATVARLAPTLAGIAPGYVASRAAEGALEEPSFERVVVDRVARSRFSMGRALEAMGVEVRAGQGPWIVVGSGRLAGVPSRLAARGIRVRDLGSWGLEGRCRVRAGTESEVERFIDAMRHLLRS